MNKCNLTPRWRKVQNKKRKTIIKIHKNIAFARGGAHLPIAHALRLPETDIILWGGDFNAFGVKSFINSQL